MTTTADIHLVLVPGFWLGGWAWDDLLKPLRAAGTVPHPVTLPGLDDGTAPTGITRDDHRAAVRSLIAGLDGEIVLVGHSGGGPLVQEVADREPGRVRRLVFVDSGPLADGAALAPATDSDRIELPSWDELAAQGSSIDGIGPAALDRFRNRARPHPAAVATAAIRVSDPARFRIPVTVICNSIPSETLREIAGPGGPLHAELLDYDDLTWVDLPTGHWPMFSRPEDLATAIARAALS